jgi:porin
LSLAHPGSAGKHGALMRLGAICLAAVFGAAFTAAHADSDIPTSDKSKSAAKSVGPAAPQPSGRPDWSDFVAQSNGASPPVPAAASSGSTADPLGFLPQGPNLFGELGGLRPLLTKYGVTLSIVENSEVLGNVTGGVRRGFEYNGLTTATLQLDTQAAFGWRDGLFNASALQIHGGNLTSSNLHVLNFATGVEAEPATRLWELWYQQKFGDALDVKVGQQSLDQEFMVSQNASYFINSAYGWTTLPTFDMPGGGPAYPLSALGVRARAHVGDSVTLLAGAFNGSPTYDNDGDPQKQNCCGVSFPLNGGVLAIAELQYATAASGGSAKSNEGGPLPGTYKIGFWYDSESFADLRYDTAGLPLGNPANNQTPASPRGDYAFYAVADQMIWRGEDPGRNINLFVRPMFTPLQDRNLISFSLNAGATMHGPIVGRNDDTAGLGMGIAQVSSGASGLDGDTAFYNPGIFSPRRSAETFLEATYQYQVRAWWQLQPDVQYFLNPGGGIVNPYNPTQKVKDELVIGLRTNITF